MALDMAQAIAQYGTLGALANAIPELKAKLEQGAAGEWTPDRFFAEVQQTGWWKGASDAFRQTQLLQQTNPGEWKQQLGNARDRVGNMARDMGVDLGGELDAFAFHMLSSGVDEQTIRNMIGARRTTGAGANFAGAAADLDAKLRAVYGSQGIGFTDQAARSAVTEILSGRQSLASYENMAREQAKTKYPTLAAQLDSGLSVKDVASPYVAAMAQTLEIPETDVDLSDNHIQRALTDRDEKGGFRTKPLWAFERDLKDDPRWDRTKNAANQTYDMLARVGADFGFTS